MNLMRCERRIRAPIDHAAADVFKVRARLFCRLEGIFFPRGEACVHPVAGLMGMRCGMESA